MLDGKKFADVEEVNSRFVFVLVWNKAFANDDAVRSLSGFRDFESFLHEFNITITRKSCVLSCVKELIIT